MIVDAAVELASHGHSVHIFTAHHDKNRCFEETRAGKFLFYSFNNFSSLFMKLRIDRLEREIFIRIMIYLLKFISNYKEHSLLKLFAVSILLDYS